MDILGIILMTLKILLKNALEDYFNMYIQNENLNDDASIILEEIIKKRKIN